MTESLQLGATLPIEWWLWMPVIAVCVFGVIGVSMLRGEE